MTFEILETQRLRLRKLTPEVFDYIFNNYSEEQICAFLGLRSEQEFLREHEKYWEGLSTYNRSFLYFQLLQKDTARVLGWCGFHTWYIDHRRAEIGYVLYEESDHRKGYMSEAILPIIAYGFGPMNLNRIEAFVGPNNTPSLLLMQKLHFTPEGYLRQHYISNGVIEDSLLFSLLKADHEALSAEQNGDTQPAG